MNPLLAELLQKVIYLFAFGNKIDLADMLLPVIGAILRQQEGHKVLYINKAPYVIQILAADRQSGKTALGGPLNNLSVAHLHIYVGHLHSWLHNLLNGGNRQFYNALKHLLLLAGGRTCNLHSLGEVFKCHILLWHTVLHFNGNLLHNSGEGIGKVAQQPERLAHKACKFYRSVVGNELWHNLPKEHNYEGYHHSINNKLQHRRIVQIYKAL